MPQPLSPVNGCRVGKEGCKQRATKHLAKRVRLATALHFQDKVETFLGKKELKMLYIGSYVPVVACLVL